MAVSLQSGRMIKTEIVERTCDDFPTKLETKGNAWTAQHSKHILFCNSASNADSLFSADEKCKKQASNTFDHISFSAAKQEAVTSNCFEFPVETSMKQKPHGCSVSENVSSTRAQNSIKAKTNTAIFAIPVKTELITQVDENFPVSTFNLHFPVEIAPELADREKSYKEIIPDNAQQQNHSAAIKTESNAGHEAALPSSLTLDVAKLNDSPVEKHGTIEKPESSLAFLSSNCDISTDNCQSQLATKRQETAPKRRQRARNHECQVCFKAFESAHRLSTHHRSHTDERPFACATCGRRFRLKNDAVRHQVVHTGERPHRCQICGKAFTTPRNRDRHVMSHTGERPFPCATCGRRFITRRHLLRHERAHNDVRPYPCSLCDKRFIERWLLKKHLQTAHLPLDV